MTKVSPFLRQETAGSVGLTAEAVIRLGDKQQKLACGFGVSCSFTRVVNNRVGARSGRTGQSSPDIPRRDMAFQPSRRTPSPMNLLDPIVDVMH